MFDLSPALNFSLGARLWFVLDCLALEQALEPPIVCMPFGNKYISWYDFCTVFICVSTYDVHIFVCLVTIIPSLVSEDICRAPCGFHKNLTFSF